MKNTNSRLAPGVYGAPLKIGGGVKSISAEECRAVSGGIMVLPLPPRTPPVDGVSRPSPK